VILFIHKIKQHKTVFDKIFIGHAFVDLLVGILVIPNYGIYSIFGFWPLGKFFCHMYISLDYTICHVGILHMGFIAYARLRSLQSPKRYHKELIISNAKTTMALLWIVSIIVWLPATIIIINFSFKERECYFNYEPLYIIFQDFFAYMIPMAFIVSITIHLLQKLHTRNKRRKMNMNRKNRTINGERYTTVHNMCYRTDNIAMVAKNAKELDPGSTSEVSIIDYDSDNLNLISQAKVQPHYTSNVSGTKNNHKKRSSIGSVHETKPANNKKKKLVKQRSLIETIFESIEETEVEWKQNSVDKQSKQKNKNKLQLNSYTKLYIILLTFCVLWLPFCILWPINSICKQCIPPFVYQASYWMGYIQSLINPILLLILNPNYKSFKSNI
jgi:hypothetical protein